MATCPCGAELPPRNTSGLCLKCYRRKAKKKLDMAHDGHYVAPKEVCDILKKHAEALKDDPERLSTEFIREMSGFKGGCKEATN